MTEPTDDEIDALVAAYLGDCGPQATRVYSFVRAVLAKWGTLRAEKIVIPTDTMEQEFQKHYRRGFAAGKKANRPAHGGEPVGEVVWAAGVPHSIREVHLKRWDLPIGTKLYTTPQPNQAQPVAVPLTDEQRNAIYDKHCFLGDNGWEIDWWKVIDEVEAAHGIKGGQHGTE